MEVIPEMSDVRPQRGKNWKFWICKVSYAIFTVHALYKLFRLVNIFLFLRGIPLHQTIIHAVLAADGVTFVFWHYWLYFKHADLNAAYVRMTLAGSISGGKETGHLMTRIFRELIKTFAAEQIPAPTIHESRDQPMLCRLSELSLQGIIAIYMHHMVIPAVFMIGACFVYEPSMQLLLYSALPDEQKNWLSMIMCFLEEMRFLLIFEGLVVPTWQLQIIAFDRINSDLKLLTESLSVAM